MLIITRDLRARFQPARDQGDRPTCLAFALSDAHAAGRPPYWSLSADYLFYHAVQHMPARRLDRGVSLAAASNALATHGQPLETNCAYSTILPSGWRPPHGLATFTATATHHSDSIAVICGIIDSNSPAALIFQPSETFYYADSAGLLPTKHPDPDIPARHAVVAVGYGAIAGRRHVLVRNSWGSNWGDSGHAWLGEDYLAARLVSVTSLSAQQ